jgi:cytosine permease
VKSDLKSRVDDHSLEAVPADDRKHWLSLTWNTAGIVTTLVILFFGALVCFVAGIKIALFAGLLSFGFGSLLGWGLSHVACTTGFSNTLITRQYGLGVKGSVLASIIFSFLIIGMLALENALLYRGILFFFKIQDQLSARILIYGTLTFAWILVTTFGFEFVARFSSVMLIAFLLVMAWMLAGILLQSEGSFIDSLMFTSQFPAPALQRMGIDTDWDKFVFSLNILIGPACALPLVSVDYGRYAKSTPHATMAVVIGGFFQSVIIMLVGGILMHAAAPGLAAYFVENQGLSMEAASQWVLKSPDSIASAFMLFGGAAGFVLMIIAQAKAQVLNCYGASLSLTNFFDALVNWRPGRFTFVVIANLIALMMLYGHILELVEAWISLLGVLLSTLSGVILMDYFVTTPYLSRNGRQTNATQVVNVAGVVTIITSVIMAHYVLPGVISIEVITSCLAVMVLYPALRLGIFPPSPTRV